jgi:hypothetical protein
MELKSLICDAGFELVVMRWGVPPPLSSFSATPVNSRASASRISRANPESGFIIAEPRAVDVGDAVALGVG